MSLAIEGHKCLVIRCQSCGSTEPYQGLLERVIHAENTAEHLRLDLRSALARLTVMRQRWADAECDRSEAIAARESERADLVDLCSLVLFHAQHDEIAPDDRQRIRDLADRLTERINR